MTTPERPIIREEMRKIMNSRKIDSMSFTDKTKIFTMKQYQANLFIQRQPLFYDEAGIWWLWDLEKKYYKMVDEIDLLNCFGDSTGEDTIRSKERTEILNALKQEGRKNIPQFQDVKLIQFANGLVHLDSPNELIEPNPNYFVANPLPYEIGDCEDTPNMDRIFAEWVGFQYVSTLYEILAYCMYADFPLHKLFCLNGKGRNGKSSFLKILSKFIGEANCTTTDLERLTTSRFESARLYKKLVCEIAETNMQELDKTQTIKRLCAGDTINFEFKNKKPFDAKSYAKIIIATNQIPATADKSDGFYSRWIIIDFPKIFDETCDIMKQIPEEEFKCLGRKLVKCLQKLLEARRFTNEGTIEEKAIRYEERSNPINKFFSEQLDYDDPEASITKNEFRKRLNQFLNEKRFRQVSDITIAKKMKERGVEEARGEKIVIEGKEIRPRVWLGVKWVN